MFSTELIMSVRAVSESDRYEFLHLPSFTTSTMQHILPQSRPLIKIYLQEKKSKSSHLAHKL